MALLCGGPRCLSQRWARTTGQGQVRDVCSAFCYHCMDSRFLSTFFIGRDAENADAEVAGSREVLALRAEIAALRDELRTHWPPDADRLR